MWDMSCGMYDISLSKNIKQKYSIREQAPQNCTHTLYLSTYSMYSPLLLIELQHFFRTWHLIKKILFSADTHEHTPGHRSAVYNELKIDLDEPELLLLKTWLGGHGISLASCMPVQNSQPFHGLFPSLPQQNGDILLCHCATTHSSGGLLTN